MNLDPLLVSQVHKAYVLTGAPKGAITRKVKGEIDPGQGEPVSVTTLTAAPLYREDSTSLKTLGSKFGEDLVLGGDVQISIPAYKLAFRPEAGDRFSYADGASRAIVDVRPSYAPGGTPTEYSLLVRR
ncbi:hypothetical protein [Mesoterricola sediminis]|uniref:Uncharacterized protein n=1 Tax=Mesoterricola sediminis TaxID=2927980 RepID=A0AA48GRJ5_9BACT|nr:hypothetical protein [Mesoterricola sediminis]BDU76299.1 hypothetical protein METESE_12570 [Mesoterricola sediminis]